MLTQFLPSQCLTRFCFRFFYKVGDNSCCLDIPVSSISSLPPFYPAIIHAFPTLSLALLLPSSYPHPPLCHFGPTPFPLVPVSLSCWMESTFQFGRELSRDPTVSPSSLRVIFSNIYVRTLHFHPPNEEGKERGGNQVDGFLFCFFSPIF